jgi:membrane-bound ClpP family serine protease
MEDFPRRIADLLETVTLRVRAMTIDKVATGVKWAALSPLLATLALVAFIFLSIGLFRILAEIVGSTIVAYAILGGIFLIAGLFLWWNRNPRLEPKSDKAETPTS